MHCLWEIIDNGVDEALAGAATRIEVTLHPDDSAEVHDDGRGIPVDKEPKTGLPGVEVVFTKLHAGGKFGGGSYVATGGLHGVGASVVNALSARLDVDVDRSPSPAGHVASSAGSPASSPATGPTGKFTAQVGPDPQGQAGREGQDRHPDPVLAGPADLHQGRQVRLRRAGHPGPADVVHRARARARDPRPARSTTRSRRSSATTAASPSSPSSWPTTSRSPTCSGCRARTRSPRPCRCSTTRGT